jgi:PAS domain S-box-containing protein
MAQQPIELILFRQLATSLVVPVFIVDARGDMLFLNEAAEQVLGVRLDEIGELRFDDWSTSFSQRDDEGVSVAPEAMPLVIAVRERRPAHGPLRITGRDGIERRLEISALPLEGAHGRFIGAVAMFWETTP